MVLKRVTRLLTASGCLGNHDTQQKGKVKIGKTQCKDSAVLNRKVLELFMFLSAHIFGDETTHLIRIRIARGLVFSHSRLSYDLVVGCISRGLCYLRDCATLRIMLHSGLCYLEDCAT